jgi:hypothetical protein
VKLFGFEVPHMRERDDGVATAVLVYVPRHALEQEPESPEVHRVWSGDIGHVPGGKRLAERALVDDRVCDRGNGRTANVLCGLDLLWMCQLAEVQYLPLVTSKGLYQPHVFSSKGGILFIGNDDRRNDEVLR